MWGITGFTVAAIVIAAFTWSAQKVYATTVGRFRLNAFCLAFGNLVIAMVLWAVIVAANDTVLTGDFMLAADVLLFLGTGCMAFVVLGEFSPLLAPLVGAGVALLTTWRAFVEPTTAYVRDGLLYFNLQGGSRLLIVGLFALVWLPAMMIVGGQVANDPLLRGRKYSLQAYFALLVALLAMFAKSQRKVAIIGLFALIVLVFLVLTVFNLTLDRARHAKKGNRSHAHATE